MHYSCGDDPTPTPDEKPEPKPDPDDEDDEEDDDNIVIANGLSYSPETPNADEEFVITFKATTSSQLYGYTGSVYAHLGVVDAGSWLFVPADWSENIDKCKMLPVEGSANTWRITLSPSIREWFASGDTPVESVGVVIRSSDGLKKGLGSDSFIAIEDDLYDGFAPDPAIEQSMPAGIEAGINIVDNSTITFALHDLDKAGDSYDFAHIVGDFNDWTLANDESSQMYRDSHSGYWWITISGLDASTEYAFQYYLANEDGSSVRIADPYARKILDPDNDKYIPASTYPASEMVYPEGGRGIVSVVKTVPDSYAWRVNDFKVEDPDNLIIYELLLRDFTETSDINGAMAKLDYLESLGVNAIELMPVQEFDGNDSWGYSPAFVFAMDKAYGTDAAYKGFIDECHSRGIAVILDVVYNHATGNNPLARLYWDSEDNATASNNPYFNVTAPHPYNVFHDFNHENEYVRQFVKRNLQFLLEEYRFDGFRFDLTKGFTQKTSSESTAGNYDGSRIAILKDYNSAIKEVAPDAVVILEHFCEVSEERELAQAGMKVWRNANHAYCQTAMGWSTESSFSSIYTGTSSMPFGSYIGYMESHDEERMAYKALKFGEATIKSDLGARMGNLSVNAVFSLLVPGPKMIWQFGEMGYDIGIDVNGRVGRKPLHWEYLDVEERAELHEVYTQLNHLRQEVPTLFDENATFTWEVGVSNWTKGRTLYLQGSDGKKLFAFGNFTSETIQTTTTLPTGWDAYYEWGVDSDVSSAAGTTMTLNPNSYRIFTNFNIVR